MNKVYIVTSCIETENDRPLIHSNIRSTFSAEERFRQTVFTVSALNLVSDHNTRIYLIDSSLNWEKYKNAFFYYPNLTFISVKEEFPEIFEACRTHPNKSHAEALTISCFLSKYKSELKQFDYFIKLSGRYFFDSFFDRSVFNEHNIDKIFFKYPLEFEFNDNWNFKMVDRRAIQQNNKLYWYCSSIYAWGREYTDKMQDLFRVVSLILNHPTGYHYHIESLLYFFTREYEKDIMHVDWKIIGFDSVSGNFIRY